MLLIAWRNSSSKTIFFSGCLKKIVFPKILQWILIFPVLLATFCSRKYCFLFWMENERWSSWKSTLKCDIFSLWSMKIIFSVLIYYYFTSTVKMIFPKNSLKRKHFLYHLYLSRKYDIAVYCEILWKGELSCGSKAVLRTGKISNPLWSTSLTL